MTKQKQLILDIINSSCRHFTAEQIFTEARKFLPKIARGTIYNNLNALLKENKIRKLCLSGQVDRFDKLTPSHHHLVCSRCGNIKDIMLPDLSDIIKKSAATDVDSYELQINYVCDNCKKLKGNSND